jgi:hypothetical protein
MYRLTIYANDGEKIVDEFEDEEELRDAIDIVTDDLSARNIKSFVASRVSGKAYEKPFWERGN